MMIIDEQQKLLENRRRVSVLIPLLFVALLWIIEFLQWSSDLEMGRLGVSPRTFSGLKGILFSPLIHGGWAHLASNTIPLLVLGFMMIYFYHHIAYRVLLFIWLIDGLGIWLIGRESYHIGASGIVYGMASFLFFSGVLRKNRQLLALSLAIVFIYGSMIWGMFPYVTDVSWEAHFVGFAAGVCFAFYYRQKGPPDDHVPEWMSEDETENLMDIQNDKSDVKEVENRDLTEVKIVYSIKENEKQKPD